jgi:hypothetical protein
LVAARAFNFAILSVSLRFFVGAAIIRAMKKTTFKLPAWFIAVSACFLVTTVFMPGTAFAQTTKAYGLFGSPQCSEWAGMSADARVNWTRAFISALSKGYEEIRRKGKQKFSNSEGVEVVVEAIDSYCAASPDALASEAVGPFLN